jgi:hypothetical protein
MNMVEITKFVVVAWPVLIALAVLSTLFMPDQAMRERDSAAGTLVERLWTLAVVWFIVMLLVLSFPHKGDITAIVWKPMGDTYANVWASLTTGWAATYLALYAGAGLAWAITYFWLYARRLGLKYVMERDLWMQAHNLKTLEGVTAEQRKDFAEQVVQKVKVAMLYEGDFPLRSWQQKRFFGANLTLWPATLTWYFVGDFAMDIGRQVWFAFRNRIHRYWEKAMSEYLEDEALCHLVKARQDQEWQEKRDAEKRAEDERINSQAMPAFMPGLDLSKGQDA